MNVEKPLISVVVPFYNVELHVADCLWSLLAQTIGNFELVCVDDGSVDDTGILLDELLSSVSNARVIHIAHSGLSVARNVGVSVAMGRLVSFVDGDDVVSPWYLETLLMVWGGGNQQLVCGKGVRGDKDELLTRRWDSPQTISVRRLKRREAIEAVAKEQLRVSAWGSLAERSLYLQEPFAPNIVFEDAEARIRHFCAVDEVILCDLPIYGYVRRAGSLTRMRRTTEAHVRGLLMAAETIEYLSVVEGQADVSRSIAVMGAARFCAAAVGQAQNLPGWKARYAWTFAAEVRLKRYVPEVLGLWDSGEIGYRAMWRIAIALFLPPAYSLAKGLYRMSVRLMRCK